MRLPLAAVLVLFPAVVAAQADTTRKSARDDWTPAFAIYGVSNTCGDFVRADSKTPQFQLLRMWTMGFVSGLNEGLDRGGSVLGSLDAKIDDFLLLVKRACERDPMGSFISGVSVTLKTITPVDATGKPIVRK